MWTIDGSSDGERGSWGEELFGDMQCVGFVIIIISGECVDGFRCDLVNFASCIRRTGVLRRIRGVVMNVFSVYGRGGRMEFIFDFFFVGICRCVLKLSVSIFIYINCFSLVLLVLYMRMCELDLGNAGSSLLECMSAALSRCASGTIHSS